MTKLHLYNIFQQKKTSFGAMTDSVVMILQKMSILWNIFMLLWNKRNCLLSETVNLLVFLYKT